MDQPAIAIYDANVLYPAPLRDLLIRIAQTGLVRARWTEMIHDEWLRNVGLVPRFGFFAVAALGGVVPARIVRIDHRQIRSTSGFAPVLHRQRGMKRSQVNPSNAGRPLRTRHRKLWKASTTSDCLTNSLAIDCGLPAYVGVVGSLELNRRGLDTEPVMQYSGGLLAKAIFLLD